MGDGDQGGEDQKAVSAHLEYQLIIADGKPFKQFYPFGALTVDELQGQPDRGLGGILGTRSTQCIRIIVVPGFVHGIVEKFLHAIEVVAHYMIYD